MEHRAVWRGHLRLALVSCPVALFSVRRARGDLHFHLINPKTGNRVRMVARDAGTDEELQRGDLVKGYEFKKDHYVLLEDADFEAARIASSTSLTIEKFVVAASIDPIALDASYYVAPDGDAGADVYLVLREAIAKAGVMGISRVVMAERERVVALAALGAGLVAHTLHETRDLVPADEIFGTLPKTATDTEMVALARQLIDRQTGRYDPADRDDRYEARLREVIEAKMKGQRLDAEAAPEPDNVIDLMAALKRSLGKSAARRSPVKSRRRQESPAKRSARRK